MASVRRLMIVVPRAGSTFTPGHWHGRRLGSGARHFSSSSGDPANKTKPNTTDAGAVPRAQSAKPALSASLPSDKDDEKWDVSILHTMSGYLCEYDLVFCVVAHRDLCVSACMLRD